MTIDTHLRSFFTFLKKNLLKLNAFEDGIQDEVTVEKQRRSTRLYYVLLFSLLFIIGLYNSVTTYIETRVIEFPSFSQYTLLTEQPSLECFCTNIAVKFEKFIQIQPFYHPICQSDFISDEYIDQLYTLYQNIPDYSISTNFHRIAVFQFKTLHALCQLTKETVSNHLQIFLQTDFIQSQLIAEEPLQTQIASLLADLVVSMSTTFLRILAFTQNITTQSLFVTGASVTSVLFRNDYDADPNNFAPFDGITYVFTDDSSCTCSSSTSNSCMGLSTFQNNTVPGFQTGCYMLSALLKSTLEVFYNQTSINLLTGSSDRFQKLNASISINKTIEELLTQMFVIQWTNQTFFQQYFNTCAPNACQYKSIQRYDLLYTITVLVGLFGGLSAILRAIVPIFFNTIWSFLSNFRCRQKRTMTSVIDISVNRVSRKDQMRNILLLTKQLVNEFNLFKSMPPSQDPTVLRRQRYTTRIYIILLFLSVMIIIIFTTITGQTLQFNIESPSLTEFIHLHQQYPSTLSCPCNQTAIDQKFLSRIHPVYHEICSSKYISSDWINLQFNQFSSSKPFTRDIRFRWQIHFQLLSTLCQMARETIEDSLQSFYQTKFVTSHALNPSTFEIQIELLIEYFKRIVSESYQRTLNLIRANYEVNQFITPSNTMFSFSASGGVFNLILSSVRLNWSPNVDSISITQNVTTRYCYSLISDECHQNIIIYGNDSYQSIPGMFETWFPLQSVLLSTLECLYDDICLSQIQQLINLTVSPIHLTPLQSFTSSSINTLANDLFIQSWNNESFFESYFDQCHPLICQYTVYTRLNVIYILTRILGLIGGINIALQLFLPLLIKFNFNLVYLIRQFQRENQMRRERNNRFYTFIRSGQRKLIELNLFPTIPPSQNPEVIGRSRRATRIYLILLMTALIILTLYELLRQETTIMIVNFPSIFTYRQLYAQYPLTLRCPCSHSAIKYNRFISQFEPQYHEICSSVFVSSEWFQSLQAPTQFRSIFSTEPDSRDHLHIQFRVLSQICTLSKKTLNMSLLIFGQNDFITASVVSLAEFHLRTKAIFDQFITSVSQQLMETMKLIQLTNSANQLGTVFSSNWMFASNSIPFGIGMSLDQTLDLFSVARSYGEQNCSCGIQWNCSTLSRITLSVFYRDLNPIQPGFLFGCFLLDSLLQSSLVCLYNNTCLGLMQAYFFENKPIKANLLTYSSLSPPNTTLETLLSRLFVIKWYESTSFEFYFNECAPEFCQYPYLIQYNIIYVITMLLAVFGGLTKGVHLIVFYAELIIYKLIYDKKNNNMVVPFSNHMGITVIDEANNNDVNNPITSTSQPGTISVQEPNEMNRNKYLNGLGYISWMLLVINVIVISAIVFFRNQTDEGKALLTSTQTNFITNRNNDTSTTIEVTNTCSMTFKYQSESYPTGLNPTKMVTGDFNRDSIIDIVVANSDSDTLSVMLGNGDGTFQTAHILLTGNGSCPKEVKIADFNNDALLDLIVSLSGSKKIVIFFGVTTNDLFVSPPYELSFYSFDESSNIIEVGDINADGFMDLVIGRYSNISNDIPDNFSNLMVFLNRGDGYQFDRLLLDDLFTTDNILAIFIVKNDNGGPDELITCDDGNYMKRFSFHLDINTVSHTSIEAYLMNRPFSMIIEGKFNNDYINDLVFLSSKTDTLMMIISISSSLQHEQVYPTNSYPTSVARINFNNDSIDDLVILRCTGTLNVHIGQSIGIFYQDYLSFNLTASNNHTQCYHSLIVFDLNQDGRDDLVIIESSMSRVRVLLGSPCDE